MNLLPQRHDRRIESEDGQAFFRLSLALMVSAVGLSLWAARLNAGTSRDLFSISIYCAYAYLWAWIVSGRVGDDAARQRLALVLDHAVFGLCLAFSTKALALLAWVPVTTSVGHGLRFGQRRGVGASLLGGLAIFCATSFGPLWQLPLPLALGMAATAVIAPVYVVRLVRTIETQRRETEARAAALETAVRLDGLTGVLSRRGLEEAWNDISDVHGRSKGAVGLVYVDLDGFKAINDTLGHHIGDDALRKVAELISTSLRSTDSVARMGGDEFAILVRNPSSEADVQQVASKVVDAVCRWGTTPDNPRLGASAGLVYFAAGAALEDVIRAADARMFAVKRQRKRHSRVEAPGSDAATPPPGGMLRIARSDPSACARSAPARGQRPRPTQSTEPP